MIEKLEWDSNHFGVPMGRLNWSDSKESPDKTVAQAIGQAKKTGLEQLMARAHPSEMEKIHALETAGFQLMDTLMTLAVDLRKNPPPAADDPSIRSAKPQDIPALTALARTAFSDRSIWLDRFHADPRISSEKADALYEEWVRNSVLPESSKASMADQTFVAEIDGAVAGFLTCVRGSETTYGKVSLNAVNATFRKRGIYRAMIHKSLEWFLKEKSPLVSVRTSIFSIAVQRAWIRVGALPTEVEHTFHWWAP
jgi:hypothetical protein